MAGPLALIPMALKGLGGAGGIASTAMNVLPAADALKSLMGGQKKEEPGDIQGGPKLEDLLKAMLQGDIKG